MSSSTASIPDYVLPVERSAAASSSHSSTHMNGTSKERPESPKSPNPNGRVTSTPHIPSALELESVGYFTRQFGFPYVPSIDPAKVAARLDQCKLKHRTALKLADWQRYDYYSKFPALKAEIYASMPRLCSYATYQLESHRKAGVNYHTQAHNVDHVHWRELSPENFIKQYEAPKIPVVISGLTDHWPAQRWTFQGLADSPYRECLFKCGEDDDGYSVKAKLKYFLQYAKTNRDDSPMYIFDASFDDGKISRNLLSDFDVPIYFRDDLFSLVGEKRRPPYRWILIGPERSGTSLHIDPLGTSAWNSLISGAKYWVLFPPSAPKSLVKGENLRQKGEDSEAVTYFCKILPRIKRQILEENLDIDVIEFIQYPGETVFVPGGFHHAVLNLEDSIAVTQNFCSQTNFHEVWKKTRAGRKHMAKRWLGKLEVQYPHLAQLAKRMNEEDTFEFKFSEKSIRKKEKRMEEKKRKKEEEMKKAMGIPIDSAKENGEDKESEKKAKKKKTSHKSGMMMGE